MHVLIIGDVVVRLIPNRSANISFFIARRNFSKTRTSSSLKDSFRAGPNFLGVLLKLRGTLVEMTFLQPLQYFTLVTFLPKYFERASNVFFFGNPV